MAEFRVLESHPTGCVVCSTHSSLRGFVDMIGDINVVRDGYAITGVVDMVVCASCIEQAAKHVGSATQEEVAEFAYVERDILRENEMLRDAVKAEQERHEQFVQNLYTLSPREFPKEEAATKPVKIKK